MGFRQQKAYEPGKVLYATLKIPPRVFFENSVGSENDPT